MKVCLPFAPGLLADVPPVFEYVEADATQHWPPEASGAEVYVPAYRFDPRILEVMAPAGAGHPLLRGRDPRRGDIRAGDGADDRRAA